MNKIAYNKEQSIHSASTSEKEFKHIEFHELLIGKTEQVMLNHTEIIIVTRGSILISYDHFSEREIKEGKIILLPAGCYFSVRTQTFASCCVFRIKEAIRHNLDKKEKPRFVYNLDTIEVNKAIMNTLYLLKENIQQGLDSLEYLKLKTEELLFFIQAFYSEDERFAFYYPLLSGNARFADFVLRNYRSVKTVREFAQLYNCSVSCFDKKFRKTFNSSVYQWMQKKKVSLLYHEIIDTDKPIRQIAAEQNFLSLPQFNDYCKKHFGLPPGKMRKQSAVIDINKR